MDSSLFSHDNRIVRHKNICSAIILINILALHRGPRPIAGLKPILNPKDYMVFVMGEATPQGNAPMRRG